MLNDDILQIICAELEYGLNSYLTNLSNDELGCRKALLSLGLTCRSFLNPALDVLWKNMRSVEPLLLVLPETTVVDGKKILLTPIAPSSWDRLGFYTSRVREFSDSDALNAHESVYTFLGQRQPLFPNLKTLRLLPEMCNSTAFLFFLSSTLQEAYLPRHTLGFAAMAGLRQIHDLGPSLSLLVSRSPGIKSLEFHGHTYSGLSHSLHSLHELERLSVTGVASPFLERNFVKVIASSPRLTHLSLSIPASNLLDYDNIEQGFPSLREVWVQGMTADLHSFVTCLPRKLHHLTIVWEKGDDQELPLEEIAAVTRTLVKFSSLKQLDIQRIISSLRHDFDNPLLWTVFKPLLELKELKLLSYDGALSLSDQRTAMIACAWPCIRDLSLGAFIWDGDVPSVQSLAYFAQHCPNLEYLTYPVRLDVSGVTAIPPTLTRHPLRQFTCSVDAAEVRNPPLVALALHQIFPILTYVTGSEDRWDEVRTVLNSFHFLRVQDRQFQEEGM
ncbi:hypothetical protein BDP27DRAFT_1450949 [Rhodocollybia butyracea]|uniref:F-box protein n=1 Tax=Rhodocollybia butyracea TaxID=206335 RepID=A0A9P5PEC8_9AGAR|nr:hypothetical protein BDP27DRAFT_1450949 [Rhodocollybia butyracea]